MQRTAVPEAAINEDRNPCAWENNIWTPGWSAYVQSIAKTPPPQLPPKDKLWVRMAPTNTRHQGRPDLRRRGTRAIIPSPLHS